MPGGRLSSFAEDSIAPPGIIGAVSGATGYYEGGLVDPVGGLRRSPGAAIVVDILDQAASARRARLWDGIYFGIIHIVPRVKDLGAVISATSYLVDVWNADEIAHLAVSVDVAGTGGVSLSGGVPLPAFWPPFGSYPFSVDVAAEGDPIIDSTVTWLFPGFDGTDHRVFGFKLTILPSAPDWESGGFQERVGLLSSVRAAHAGHEQRRSLSSRPTRELEFTGLAIDPVAAGELVVKLFNGGLFLFGVPYWPDATALGAALSPGATSIPVETTARIFEPGGLVALWRNDRTWQTLTIAPGGVAPGALTTSTAVAGSWSPNDTLVVPVLPARLEEAARLEHPKAGHVSVQARFRTEPL